MGEVLVQVWLKFTTKYISGLLNKKVNAQKEFENFLWGSPKLLQADEKCTTKIKQRKNKWGTHKNVNYGRKCLIGPIQKTDKNNLDKLWVNGS